MDAAQALRVALSALLANKLRSSLTMMGMVIGVAAVITLMSIGQGAQAAVQEQFNSLGVNLVFVEPGTSNAGGVKTLAGTVPTLTYEDAKVIADSDRVPSAGIVSPQVFSPAQLIYGGTNTGGRVMGVDPQYAEIRNYKMSQGTWITDEQLQGAANVAVLGPTIAQTLFGQVNPIGLQFRANTGPGRGAIFTVIGLAEARGGTGFFGPDTTVFIPITSIFRTLIRPRAGTGAQVLNGITVQAIDAEHIGSLQDELTELLLQRHHISDPTQPDFSITSQQDRLQTRLQVTAVLTMFLGAVAGISLVVGGIGIMNIMIVSVTERTREIGIRKAVGARRHDILMQFLVESLLVSVLGGIGGIAVGIGLARLISGQQLNGQAVQTLVSTESILLAAGVSAAVGLFFGIYPASRAARLHPIQALRYE
jgi:putative ABC transport system permease protein